MFLDGLCRRNPCLVESAMALHRQGGRIPANADVLDLDAVEANAHVHKSEAERQGLKIFAMTKQLGRASSFLQALKRAGIDRSVAVGPRPRNAQCWAQGRASRPSDAIPKFEANAAGFRPDYWTMFNEIKATEAASTADAAGYVQDLLARIKAPGDTFYRGHQGGFEPDIATVAAGRFAGITTFPAQQFDKVTRKVKATLTTAADTPAKAGRSYIEINAPGTTSSVVLAALAEAGATQCEPGNGLHRTTALHAVEDLPELPAELYLTEVSHLSGGKAYCFGGGFHIAPTFPGYQVKAIISAEPTTATDALFDVEIPPPSAIDYYPMIDATGSRKPTIGDSAVLGFRGQAFVTRDYVVGVSAISTGAPIVESIENGFDEPERWPV